MQGCFKGLQTADHVLNALVSQQDFVSRGNAKQHEKHAAIKAIITDTNFVTKLDECIKILKPIDEYIVVFQCDAVPCSEVYRAFVDLEDQMHKLPNIDEEKKNYLVELVKKRFEFMYGDVHGIGYVLNPRFLDDKMSHSLRKEIEDFNFPTEDGTMSNERRDQLEGEYTAFCTDALSEREKASYLFKMIGESKTVLQWWIAYGTIGCFCKILPFGCSQWPLQLQHQNETSTFGFIHSKLKNHLSPDKVKKLVYNKTNSVLMADGPTDCYASDSDENEPNEGG